VLDREILMTTDIYSLKANVKHWTLIATEQQVTANPQEVPIASP
jgi:hypothetical protein